MQNQPIFIFIGISGSGKTTLANLLAKEYNLKITDVLEYVRKLIEKEKKKTNTLTLKELRTAYINFIHDLPNRNFNIIEIATDWPETFLPQIIEIAEEKSSSIAVIFCSCSLPTILSRIQERGRPIPEATLKKQSESNTEDISKICRTLGIRFIYVNTENNDIDLLYQKLKSSLGLN